jgi:RimJ/RimL family protein N-acetyltransferase
MMPIRKVQVDVPAVSMININRLLLIPMEPVHVDAQCISNEALTKLLGYTVPESFPLFKDAFKHIQNHHREHGKLPGWQSWFFIHRASFKLIGLGGFGDLTDGSIELGYEFVPEVRRQEFATEGAQAVISWAFSQEKVRTIDAHTLPVGTGESVGVLKKLGFAFVGNTIDSDAGDVLKWELRRQGG